LATPVSLPSELYASFTGAINADALQRITKGFDIAMTQKVQHVHLFFQSTGGWVNDGVAMYNYFKALPLELTVYNPGVVSSIAVVAYLGARHRKTSAHAVFMIHRTQCNFPQGIPASRAQTMIDAAILDDQRTEAILKERLALPAEKWAHFKHDDLHFSATEAVEYGIADEIADFSPPSNGQIYNI
jgi:ATP-dependent Clp protease protease subunit